MLYEVITRIAEWIDEGVAREWFRVRAYEMDTRYLSSRITSYNVCYTKLLRILYTSTLLVSAATSGVSTNIRRGFRLTKNSMF